MEKYDYQIYKITNTKNNKIYIGKTRRSAYKRLEEHAKGHCDDLRKDIEEFGIDNFKIKILRSCNGADDAKTMERFHIENASKKGKDLYNIYCTLSPKASRNQDTIQRKLFGFILGKLKRSDHKYLCKNDFDNVVHKLKHTKEKYIAVELDDFDVILVRRA